MLLLLLLMPSAGSATWNFNTDLMVAAAAFAPELPADGKF